MAKKILIIDDEVDIIKMLAYRLKARGYIVVTTTSGKAAAGMIRDEKPDLVLLDYRIPDLNGTFVAGEMKSNKETVCIPIILITASVDNIADKAVECRAVDYIAKPIEPEELYEKVKKHIGE